MPVSTVQYDEVYKIYQRVDLMRAKYRHADLTLKGWCFHGNQAQGWAGGACSGGRLIPVAVDRGIALLSPAGININPTTHPWMSLHVDASIQRDASTYLGISSQVATTLEGWLARAGYRIYTKTNDEISINGIRFSRKASETLTYMQFSAAETQFMNEAAQKPVNVRVSFMGAETDTSSTVLSLCPATSNRSMVGDIRPATDNNPVTGVGIYLTPPSWWPPYWKLIGAVEYIKFDTKNVFAPMTDEELAITTDFNVLRQEVEVFNKASVSWENPTPVSAGSRVRQYVDIIKRSDIDQANRILTTAAPYNGCGTCDLHTCNCDFAKHGSIPCAACNGCNGFTGCSCNSTCYTVQKTSCTCDYGCYGQSGCSCNGECYGQGCNLEHVVKSNICICDFTYGRLECRVQYGDYYDECQFNGCNRNSPCNTYTPNRCGRSCDLEWSTSVSCGGCNIQEGWLESTSCTCDQGCYGEPTGCSCQTCYGESTSCNCYGSCHGYTGCSICNSCNAQVACVCDSKCYTETCGQCNLAKYSETV